MGTSLLKIIVRKATTFLKQPRVIIIKLLSTKAARLIPDKTFIQLSYWSHFGKRINLNNPVTFNEKLQWLKLYDRRPEYSKYVDKYEVRDYIKNAIGGQYLIPLIGIYESVSDIPWDALPDKFVLKCTHGSGMNIICNDKSKLNIEESRLMLNKWMKNNFYWYGREWPYRYIKPRIICEKYLQNNITDYKFMCFNGEPKIIQVHRDRLQDHKLDFYDTNWNKTNIRRDTKTDDVLIPRPQLFNEMLSIARVLSQNEIHVRIDLYEVDQKIYFGEKTYYSASGFSLFAKEEYDELLGSWIHLPIDKKNKEIYRIQHGRR